MVLAKNSRIQPNIIWLVLDCARFDRISAHGYSRPTTPYIDQLIYEGLDYTNAYSAAVWSLPSYTSLLTGLYPRQHGVNVSTRKLSPDIDTLAQSLTNVGYKTACFSNNAWLSPRFGVGKGFSAFQEMWFSSQKTMAQKADFLLDKAWGILKSEADKGARRTNKQILRWLREHADVPFFLFAAYVEPHAPYSSYRRLISKVVGKDSVSLDLDTRISSSEWVKSLPQEHQFSPETLAEINLCYDLEMRYIDSQVEDLLGRLHHEKRLENTVVIITADHGELLGEHNMLGHQFSVAEQLRRVPLIVWSPDFWLQNEQIEDVVQTLDVPVTICSWANAYWDKELNPFVLPEKEGVGEREYAITDYPEPYLEAVRRRHPNVDLSRIEVGLTCISGTQFKLVCTDDGRWWGFDLSVDPDEETRLDIRSRSEFSMLEKALHNYLRKQTQVYIYEEEMDQTLKEHLKALGYLD